MDELIGRRAARFVSFASYAVVIAFCCLQAANCHAKDQTGQTSLAVYNPQRLKATLRHQAAPAVAPSSLAAGAESKPSSNHRLVSKIKDARHRRRRHRYGRHRKLNRKQNLLEASNEPVKMSMMGADFNQANINANVLGQTSSLTALESIVEEVARAGQLNSLPPSQDLQLDGSSVVQVPAQPLEQPAMSPGGQVAMSGPTTSQPGANRGVALNSRGFFLTSMLSRIMNVLNVTEFALEMREGISSRASCMACNAVVGLFLSPLYSREVFSVAIRTVCTSFKIQQPRVCAGLVESFQHDLEFIRKNTKLTRDEVCGVVFGIDCARRATFNLFWTVPIPLAPLRPTPERESLNKQDTEGPTKQQIAQAIGSDTPIDDAPDLFEYRKSGVVAAASSALAKNASQNEQLESMQRTAKAIALGGPNSVLIGSESTNGGADDAGKITSFVHLTDIHIDPYYEPGSLNDCKEPLCCRATSGQVALGDKRRQAGKWGDYGNCDTPVRTLRSALGRIRDKHPNAEYWIWTGDISPHDIWNISKQEATNHVRLVTKLVREYSNGLPVFPVIGNHEAHPVNSFSPPEIKGRFSMSWLYDLLADEWKLWLPKDALKTMRIGGYYKLRVRKGFRIIALNTNYCARLNPWSFYDPVDPANQLKWLVEELVEAELSQDKVHIIGHVPPDNRECTQAWLFNFINIVDRFKDTIEAQFYGHTHRDEFRVMYSLKTDDPIGIQYIGPSLTPFTENNPAYRIYHQNRRGLLVDAETYFFNLTEANESPMAEPRWQFSYNAQNHMNMTQGLTAPEWHAYTQRLHDDEQLFESFFKNYYRSSDVKSGQVCRAKCKFQILSDLRLGHPYKTKPKPFIANRKTSNHHHHGNSHTNHHHYHHKRLRHAD